eukprot:469963-Amorphochlora_amoeboformis.AAC.2
MCVRVGGAEKASVARIAYKRPKGQRAWKSRSISFGEKVSVEINGDDDLTTLRKKINQQLHKPKKEDNADKIPTVEGVRTRHLRRHSDVGSRSPSVRRHRRNMSGGVSALGLPQPSPPRSRDVSTRPRSDSRGTPRTPPARSSRSNSEGTNLQKNGNAWEEGKASQKKNTPKYSIKMARTSKKAILRLHTLKHH